METSEHPDEAFVTLVTNDSYATGALVLGDSLRKVNTSRKLAILVAEDVSQIMRSRLLELWDFLIEVEKLDSNDQLNLSLIERPELGVTFTKLKIWTLTQFKKCVFLDADTLVIQNVDDLFERQELSAAPDIGWPDCFNSGVFVFVPCLETFNALIQFANQHGSFDGGDQGLLNVFFKNWAADLSLHLPFVYNMVSSNYYTYLPAYKQYGKDVKIVHFLGSSKPWSQHYDYSKSQVSKPSSDKKNGQGQFVQLWWDRYNSIPQPSKIKEAVFHPQHEDRQYHENDDNNDISPEQSVKEYSINGQKAWERGQIDFTWTDRFSAIQQHLNIAIGEPEGYQIYEENAQDHYEEQWVSEDAESYQSQERNYAFEMNCEERTSEYIKEEQYMEPAKADNHEFRHIESDHVLSSNDHLGSDESQVSPTNDFMDPEKAHLLRLGSDESQVSPTNDFMDPEKAHLLRWENGQIDFGGVDRFEFIQQYLDSLIKNIRKTVNESIKTLPKTIKDDEIVPCSQASSKNSVSQFACSDSPVQVEMISRGTQTTCEVVSMSVQTDFVSIV